MTSFYYVMNYLHLRGTISSQMYHLTICTFHKDGISLIWQSGHEFIICNCYAYPFLRCQWLHCLLFCYFSVGEFAPTYSSSCLWLTWFRVHDPDQNKTKQRNNSAGQIVKVKLIGKHTKLWLIIHNHLYIGLDDHTTY